VLLFGFLLKVWDEVVKSDESGFKSTETDSSSSKAGDQENEY